MSKWIKFKGNQCPVPAGSDVEVKWSNGDIDRNNHPEHWGWNNDDLKITHYRIHRPADVPYIPSVAEGPETVTRRDMFAMAALTGHLSYSHYNEGWGDYHNNGSTSDLAKRCYGYADAMEAARGGK